MGPKQPSFHHRVEGDPGDRPWPWVSMEKKPQVLMEVWYIRSWCPFRLSELPEILPPTLGLFWDSGLPKKQPLNKGAGMPVQPAPGLAATSRKLLPALARRPRPPTRRSPPPCPAQSPKPPSSSGWPQDPDPGPGRRGSDCAGGFPRGLGAGARRGQSGRAPGGAGGAWAPRGRGGLRRPGTSQRHCGSCVPPLPGREGWPRRRGRGGELGPRFRAGEWAGPYLILKSRL